MEEQKKSKKYLLIILAAVVLILVFLMPGCMSRYLFPKDDVPEETYDSFSVIRIEGTIGSDPSDGYNHEALMEYVDYLMEDETNHGIFLLVNSGGGAVYESDEFYLKLQDYKEMTGRPIHAYFTDTAASGAYYISCAADYISGNRNGLTGSIGVIISYLNYTGLYDKLGVTEVIISSGPNKAMGHSGIPLTDEQRAIFQSIVDEAYEQFVGIVAAGRGLSEERVRELADGRVYTMLQAKELGLIDEVETLDEALKKMENECGYPSFEPDFSIPVSIFDVIIGKVEDVMPKSDLQIIQEKAESSLNGVPLYLYVR